MLALPQTMTAIAVRPPAVAGEPGPASLVPETRPVPTSGPGEILIKVAAAGVNRVDVMQRLGHYVPPPGASDILGVEIAGEVVARGDGALRFALGDVVCGLVPGGGYAGYTVVHETNALPVPVGLTLIEAAALPQTFFTAWLNVFEFGGLKAGETLLVHGGTSGVGTVAVLLAKAFGARVIATAGSDAKTAACRAIGADVAINHRNEDFAEAVLADTGGRGADLILDMVGGSYLGRNCQAAAVDGRIVHVAFIESPAAAIDLRVLMRKRLTLTGSMLRPRSVAQKAAIAETLAAKVWPLLAQGRCKPVIDSVFPLGDAAKAHARMESSVHIGKIMLTV